MISRSLQIYFCFLLASTFVWGAPIQKPLLVDLKQVRDHALPIIQQKLCSSLLTEQGVWYWDVISTANIASHVTRDHSAVYFAVKPDSSFGLPDFVWMAMRYRLDGDTRFVFISISPAYQNQRPNWFIGLDPLSGYGRANSSINSQEVTQLVADLQKKFPLAQFRTNAQYSLIEFTAPDERTSLAVFQELKQAHKVVHGVFFNSEQYGGSLSIDAPQYLDTGLQSKPLDVNTLRTKSNKILEQGWVFENETRLPDALGGRRRRKGNSK